MNHGNWSVEIGEGKGNKEIYGYQDNIKGRENSDYTYIRVQKTPKPDRLVINPVDTSQMIISGRAVLGSNLEISRNYNTHNLNTDSAGNWNYNFNGNLQANEEIKVREYVNNTWSDYVYKRVVQLPAKNNITIDLVDTSQRVIRGKGEPGAKVEIYHNNYGTYNVDVDSSRKLEL